MEIDATARRARDGGADRTGPAADRAAPEGAADRAGPPRKLFKIGEVMEWSGISRQTLHNYTILGLITEVERTGGHHRLYGEEVFERLRRIQELKRQKRTLKEIRRILGGRK